MLRNSSRFTRVILPNCSAVNWQTVATKVYGDKGRSWRYDPDFEPTEPCLRVGLKGNPYGTRPNPLRSTIKNRKLYRLPLDSPLWEDVYKELDDIGLGRDWLDLSIPAVLPEFPMESKKQNPYYDPTKYPTIRNAYYDQQQAQFKEEQAEFLRQHFYKKNRLQNRWVHEKKKHDALRQALEEISPEVNEEIDAGEIESQTKAIEAASPQ